LLVEIVQRTQQFSLAIRRKILYIMYMSSPDNPSDPAMLSTSPDSLSVVQAREQFPSLLEAAESGTETVIARRGRPVAVLGPLSLRRTRKPVGLDSPIGSGTKLWGPDIGRHVDQQRGEWD
jgi:prevent-host-death family protein